MFVTNSFDQTICNKIHKIRNVLNFHSIFLYYVIQILFSHTVFFKDHDYKPILILQTLIQRVQAQFAPKGASRASVLVGLLK